MLSGCSDTTIESQSGNISDKDGLYGMMKGAGLTDTEGDDGDRGKLDE